MAGDQELAEGAQQLRHVLEVQPGGRLVEQEQLAAVRGAREHRAGLREVAGELQALRLTAGQRGHRLAELQVLEPHVHERTQALGDLGHVGEEGARLGDGELQHLRDAEPPAVGALAADLEHLVAVAPAVAVRAAQVDVGEELHLHVLETVAGAGGAAPVAGVEAERAGGVLALLGGRLRGIERADGVEGAHVARRVGARGAADRVLVDHHHVVDEFRARKSAEPARRLGGLAVVLQERGVEHVLDQGRLARAEHPGDAHQPLQRDAHVEVAQVVLARALELEPAVRARLGHDDARLPGPRGLRLARGRDALCPAQVLTGEGAGVGADRLRAAEEHHLAAALAGAGTEVEDPVGLEHDLRVVLDHDQRVARIAQPLHDPDHALHVARVQADGGLIQHEQRVDERGAERGGEVDALHLPARERARLAVQGEVAQAHVGEVAEAAADLLEQELGGFIQRRRQRELPEELVGALDRQEHQVVDREAGQARKELPRPLDPLGHERGCVPQGRARQLGAPQPPQERLGLEARPGAGGAGRVGAVARQEHAHVHLVGARLEPREEALGAVPDLLGPRPLALDHPAPGLGGQLAPGHVQRDAAQLRELLQVLLALGVGLGLPGLDGPAAQALGLIRDDQAVVDADGAPEAAAGLAGAERGVEGELARGGRAVGEVALRAVQLARVAPGRKRLRRVGLVHQLHVHAAAPDPQRGLEGLEHAAALGAAHPQAVLHHLQEEAGRRGSGGLAALLPRGLALGHWSCRHRHRLAEVARVALAVEELAHLLEGEVLGYLDREGEVQARVAGGGGARGEVLVDALGGVGPHGLAAAPAVQLRHAGEQQLQVIVELGHRPDGRARGAHGVGLVDGDGRRDAGDRIHLRLVHAVQELARVGREGLDVAALAFRVEGVEDERGLARAGHAGDHHQLVQRDVEVESLEVVLARATQGDGVTGGVGHSVTVAGVEGVRLKGARTQAPQILLDRPAPEARHGAPIEADLYDSCNPVPRSPVSCMNLRCRHALRCGNTPAGRPDTRGRGRGAPPGA